MEKKNVAIIGVGLMGGSLALRLKEKGIAAKLIGVEANESHQKKALERGLVDEITSMDEARRRADVMVLAVHMDAELNLLPEMLSSITNQVIIDLGSNKEQLIRRVENHPRRGRFVATHPMWGTEYSGPEAAVPYAFEGKAVVICNPQQSDTDALLWTKSMYKEIGMHIIEMDAAAHDLHAAYVSHISHITSFALANTVLEKEKEESAIFEMASAGFESTVRLAKSNPDMWLPVFMQNRDNVLDVLNEHISQLRKFKSCLEKENWEYLRELMQGANRIRRIIK
jgi:prephenate dehydrogenase